MSYFMVCQGCHQLLWNVLHYVSSLVTDESTATAGEALGVIALQMMGLALQDRGYDISIFFTTLVVIYFAGYIMDCPK